MEEAARQAGTTPQAGLFSQPPAGSIVSRDDADQDAWFSAQGSLDLSTPVDGAVETLSCEHCGREWTRNLVRGRKPTRCVSCASGRSTDTTSLSATRPKERNRRLAAAMRDLGKEPTGAAWTRAKGLLEAGQSFEAAARDA